MFVGETSVSSAYEPGGKQSASGMFTSSVLARRGGIAKQICNKNFNVVL